MMSDNEMAQPYELLIRAGRLLCPATGRDEPGMVAINGDRIVTVGTAPDGGGQVELDFPDAVLLPGLVDLHAHPARGQSRYGIDPDQQLLPFGVTTVLSQGDAGADNWDDYRRTVVDAAQTRVRMALHLSRRGETDPDCPYGSFADADVEACAAAVAADPQHIWGIAVNTSTSIGLEPRPVLERAIQVAERTDRPLLVGTRLQADWPLQEQLPLLRAGDVVTYCLHPQAEGLVAGGRVRDCVWQARERGVLFDVGHGMASFSFAVAEVAVAEGFLPDTISSDQYRRHIGSVPRHGLALTVSKLIAAGMPEVEAFARATARPARILGLDRELGALRPGACADLTVLRCDQPRATLQDVTGDQRVGPLWEPVVTVRAGRVIEPTPG